jgi:hypothetical protein
MLEEYMKQLEDVIDKDEYDRSNFEEKILKREEQLNDLNQENHEESEQPQNQLNQKISQDSKKLKNSNNLANRPAWGSNTQKNKPNKAREQLKQSKVLNAQNINNKVVEKDKKNIKYKKQREEVKKKKNDLEKELNTKEDQLLKASKEKDELSKYLFKIEKVVKGNTGGQNGTTVMTFTDKDINDENNNKNFEAFDSQSLTINISGGSPNVIMEDGKGQKIIIISKKDLMKYLNKLYKENQGLKNFQNQIFNLSKSYDDINNNLADCISSFQELCMNNPGDKISMQDVDQKLNELKKHIESSLETKQNEYSILMDKRDEDLSLLRSEFIEHEKDMKESGNDRLEEQRKIMELQVKKEELERQIAELEVNEEKDENNDENNEEY